MNWYDLLKTASTIRLASVTFSIPESLKIAQPKTVGEIAWELPTFIWYRLKRGQEVPVRNSDVDSPENWFDYTGVFVVHFDPAQVPQDKLLECIQLYIQNIALLGITAQCNGTPQSNEHVSWFSVEVTVNETQHLEQMPEMNVANDNANQLLSLLGITNNDWSGDEPLQSMLARIQNAMSADMNRFTRPAEDTHMLDIPEDATPEERQAIIREQAQNRQHGRSIDGGLGEDRLQSYLIRLEDICEWGIQNGFTKIQWA